MLRVNLMTLGDAVREARGRRHLSQREAALQLGVSERTIQMWETQEVMPWPKHRRAIIEWLAEEEAA